MNKSLIVLAILCFSTLALATNEWVKDGDYVYWQQGAAKITVYPHTSSEFIHHVQYANFTWTGTPAKVNISFVFDKPISSGRVDLLQDVTKMVSVRQQIRMNYTVLFENVTDYVETNQPCGLGDSQNLLRYLVTMTNGTSMVACFDSYFNDSDDYTLTYSVNETTHVLEERTVSEWTDISSIFTEKAYGNYRVYTVNDVVFTNPTNYQTRITYNTPARQTNGKFSIYVHAGSPDDVISGVAPIYVELDPWWNTSYQYFSVCYVNSTVAGNLVNFPARCDFNTSNSTLWNTTTCANVRFTDDNVSLLNYDIDSNSSAFCGNASVNTSFWIGANLTGGVLNPIYAYLGNVGAGSGETSLELWGNASAQSVWHFNGAFGTSATDEMGINTLTATGAYNISTDRNKCKFGWCAITDSATTRFGSSGIGTIYPNDDLNMSGSLWVGSTVALGNDDVLWQIGYGSPANRITALSNKFWTVDKLEVHDWTAARATLTIDSTDRVEYYGFDVGENIVGVQKNTSIGNGTGIFARLADDTLSQIFFACTHTGGDCVGNGIGFDEARLYKERKSGEWHTAEYNQSSTVGAAIMLTQVVTQNTFQNVTPGHMFNVTAGVLDSYGATDINETNITTTFGTCVWTNNTSNGNYFNVTYNCTAAWENSTNITIGFLGVSGLTSISDSSANTYPDNAPNTDVPTITPATAYANSILTCNNQTFADQDGDEINLTSMTWKWYENGTVITGQTTNHLNVLAIGATRGANITCEETVAAQNWTKTITNTSIGTVISSAIPVALTPVLLTSSPTNSSINCSCYDYDGGTDINYTNITTTNGTTITAMANGTSGIYFWQTWNITGMTASTSVNITCGFNDTTNNSDIENLTFTTPLFDSHSGEIQNATAETNTPITWYVTYDAGVGLHTCNYTFNKTDILTGEVHIYNVSNLNVTINLTAVDVIWACQDTESPYTIYLNTTAPTATSILVTGTTLGSNEYVQNITLNASYPLTYNVRYTYPTLSTDREMWKCSLNNHTTCDSTNLSQWSQVVFTETAGGSGYVAFYADYMTDNESVFTTSYTATSAPSTGGGGGGSVIAAQINATISALLPSGKAAEVSAAVINLARTIHTIFKNTTIGISNYWWILLIIAAVIYYDIKRKKGATILSPLLIFIWAMIFVMFVLLRV